MIGTPFYHETIKKAVTVFGTLFNNIQIQRKDGSGNTTNITIPIHYAQKDKFRQRYVLAQTQDYNSAEVQVTAPRLAFENTGITYDPTRKLNTLQPIVTETADPDTQKHMLMRTPYTLSFSLYLLAGKAEDGYKVIEQIVPYFTPDLTVTVNDVIPYDMPIVLVDFSVEDGWEGDMDARRRIEWTFNFDLQTYFYGVQTDKKIITKTITDTFDDLDSTVPATTVESTSLGDTFTYRTD
tara:strand:- start:46 stop:759 length:714 start_codon:yes stop_codon:yes gene_type:complete